MKYLFFDIDGTLIDEYHKLPLSTKKTLKQLKENGHFIAIATSRPHVLTYKLARDLHKFFRLRKPTSFRWWEEQPTSYPCDSIYLCMVADDTSPILQAK